jgi:RNA polymerase sigma-70 factor (ECF subfamily)
MARLMDPLTLDVSPPSAISTPTTTIDLVIRAGNGDTAAFETLIAERLDSLYRTAWAILGNEADARDATQDACLSAWRNLPRLRDPDKFDAWLTRVLVNGCRMRLRIRSRVREIQMEPDLDRPGPTTDDASSQAEANAIARAFDRLNPDARAILVLHHLQHQPVTAIADILWIPVGTVKSRLHTARTALGKALERERR